jgi:hypothetical protein
VEVDDVAKASMSDQDLAERERALLEKEEKLEKAKAALAKYKQ